MLTAVWYAYSSSASSTGLTRTHRNTASALTSGGKLSESRLPPVILSQVNSAFLRLVFYEEGKRTSNMWCLMGAAERMDYAKDSANSGGDNNNSVWECVGKCSTIRGGGCHGSWYSGEGRDLPWPFGSIATAGAAAAYLSRSSALPAMAVFVLHQGGELLLALAASGGGDPGALDVGGALEATALAAGPAPQVGAVLLGLVAAVLATHHAAAASRASSHRPPRKRRQIIRESGGGIQLVLPLDLVLLPQLEAPGVSDVLAPASATAIKEEALRRRDHPLLIAAMLLAATATSEKEFRHIYSSTRLVTPDP
ncbi:hypothetical protein GW17_00017403 [Ensete ventricosum]|uniref:Uncharacterized protein n=1 Tax=Ensete ventricosum TaxID=4639 RepID=A0A426XGJ1_ENSVE|nr:hypothetical protein B296_00052575 [Ensete ventricosum]RWW18609.1 hypothetical protein GW17_00017403 [Ensete ventricosum]